MKDPIQKYFQVGTVHFMSYPTAHHEYVESLRKILLDDFFTAVEIKHVEDDETRAIVKKMLDESGIKVCYGAQPSLLGPGFNPNHLEETERKKAEDVLLAAIDEAEYLGAKGIAFLAGKYEKDKEKEAYQQLLITTRNLCDYAKTKDMMIEMEIFDFNFDKAALIGPAPLAAKFAADMCTTHNNFGYIVDLSHFPLTYETSKFVFRTLRQYITHLHIGNAVMTKGAPGYGDLHPRFGFPNSEVTVDDVLDFFRVCKAEGFLDADDPIVMSFEVQPFGDEDADLVVANTKRVINRAWALLEDF
ncbi:MAG TPA: sugar phosphate isomerase/epimerase [Clostridiaceae bacterium]|nr:sugar phosphate isomerase/epimerase [Clostridiaceae bacterium]